MLITFISKRFYQCLYFFLLVSYWVFTCSLSSSFRSLKSPSGSSMPTSCLILREQVRLWEGCLILSEPLYESQLKMWSTPSSALTRDIPFFLNSQKRRGIIRTKNNSADNSQCNLKNTIWRQIKIGQYTTSWSEELLGTDNHRMHKG